MKRKGKDRSFYTCCIWMSLRDGRERKGGVPEAQGGVLLSASDTGDVCNDTTGIGFEGKKEINLTFPSLLPSE